jgi:hypothetical protein
MLKAFLPADGIFICTKPKEDSQFLKALADLGQEKFLFSVGLSEGYIFFESSFVGMDEGGIKFQIPKILFKVQRRKHPRASLARGATYQVEFAFPNDPKKKLRRQIIDISAGGLALHCYQEEIDKYKVGMSFQDFVFQIKTILIRVTAEIKRVQALPIDSPFDGYIVGFQFLSIRPQDVDLISRFAFEKLRESQNE